MTLTERDISRFWSKVIKTTEGGCWAWSGTHYDAGYTALAIRGKNTGAHRISYFLSGRELTPGLVVRHLCNNKGCVNPAHLEIGTQADNIADRDRAGRQAKGARSGVSKLNPNSVAARRMIAEKKRGGKNPMARRIRDNTGRTFDSITAAVQELGLSMGGIWKVLNGHRKQIRGLRFFYIEAEVA